MSLWITPLSSRMSGPFVPSAGYGPLVSSGISVSPELLLAEAVAPGELLAGVPHAARLSPTAPAGAQPAASNTTKTSAASGPLPLLTPPATPKPSPRLRSHRVLDVTPAAARGSADLLGEVGCFVASGSSEELDVLCIFGRRRTSCPRSRRGTGPGPMLGDSNPNHRSVDQCGRVRLVRSDP